MTVQIPQRGHCSAELQGRFQTARVLQMQTFREARSEARITANHKPRLQLFETRILTAAVLKAPNYLGKKHFFIKLNYRVAGFLMVVSYILTFN